MDKFQCLFFVDAESVKYVALGVLHPDMLRFKPLKIAHKHIAEYRHQQKRHENKREEVGKQLIVDQCRA